MIALIASLLLSVATSQERTLPVLPTPESSTVVLKIVIPQEGQRVSSPTWVQFRIDGFALGSASQFERAGEVAVSKMGQTVHVVVDNQPYFPINGPAVDPFDESGNFYDMSYKFKIPYKLDDGAHTIRMFPARSYGESLKGDKTFAAVQFYVGNKTEDAIDLSSPYITYNEPSSLMPLKVDKPVLLDFYLSNAELSADGYKVRLSIDGKINRLLTLWVPYYIYGLSSGHHTIRLELLDAQNKLVPGAFNDVEQSIVIH